MMKTKKIRKKPNCKQGNVACGYRCQPKSFKCPSEKGEEVSKASDKFVGLFTVSVAEAKSSGSVSEHQKKLFSVFDGQLRLDDSQLKELFEEIISSNYVDRLEYEMNIPFYIKKVQRRLKDKKLSTEEIAAVLAWVDWTEETYKPINEVLYGKKDLTKDEKEYGEKLGLLLAVAVKNLKEGPFGYSEENLAELDGLYPKRKTRADRKVARYIKIEPESLEDFLKPYKEANEANEEYVEKTFAAATLSTKGYGTTSRNVEIEIELLNEESSAVFLETFKEDHEGEVMIPPGARFEVKETRAMTLDDVIPKVSISTQKALDEAGLNPPKTFDEIKTFLSQTKAANIEINIGLDVFISDLEDFYELPAEDLKKLIEGRYKVVLRELQTAAKEEEPSRSNSMKEFYNNSLSLFSKESKAERRAKIKGLSNEKELKKIQLKEENEAWIFVRLKRELDRLEKKSGEAKDAGEITALKDLLSRIMDGDEEAKAEGRERVEGKVKVSGEKKIASKQVEILEIVEEVVNEDVDISSGEELIEIDQEVISELRTRAEKVGVELFEAKKISSSSKLYNEIALAKQSILGDMYGTDRYKLLRSKRAVAELLHRSLDFSKMSQSELAETFDFANEMILLDMDYLEYGDLHKEASRRLHMKLSGDSTKKIKAAGDESLRGIKDIPPLPEIFSESSSGGSGRNLEPVDESFRNFLEESRVMIQVSPKALNGILKVGRIKNTFESGSVDSVGSGKDYKNARKEAESRKFGLSAEANGKLRPIYGYIESPHYLNSTSRTSGTAHYGEIQIRLKSDVKKRSTITLGDSLDDATIYPTPILDPRKECLSGRVAEVKSNGGAVADVTLHSEKDEVLGKIGVGNYIEAQIFGGVSLEDIEFIVLPKNLVNLHPYLLPLLAEKGVEFKIV